MSSLLPLVGFGILLVVIQVLAALPWLIFLSRDEARQVIARGSQVSNLFILAGPVLSLMLLLRDQVIESTGQLATRKLLGYVGGALGGAAVLGALLGFGMSSIQDAE